MRIRTTLAGIAMLLLASICAAGQEQRDLEQDLKTDYIGRSFETQQPYLNREVWYDHEGNITEHPTPACANLYGILTITDVRVSGNQVIVEATREGKRPPMRDGVPVWPSYASKQIRLRFVADGKPWTASDFEAAFQHSLALRGHFDPLPPGATAPPAESDPRIAYYLEGAPVYRPGKGVSPPRGAGRLPDPEYTDAARRARAGGTVVLKIVVNEDGTVANAVAAQPPLGFGLDEQAVRTVQQWQFTPASLEGKPVKVEISVTTNFCLY